MACSGTDLLFYNFKEDYNAGRSRQLQHHIHHTTGLRDGTSSASLSISPFNKLHTVAKRENNGIPLKPLKAVLQVRRNLKGKELLNI
jgi:hypothetical protein